MTHPFRFAVNLIAPQPGPDWAARCREAEQLGYSVFVPDHLGLAAPFPALAAAAAGTGRAGLGTFVLNAAFWNPTLLARDVETVDGLSGGRLTLGLGTGYNRAEFEQAGLPWESPGARVDRLARLVDGPATVTERAAPFRMSGPAVSKHLRVLERAGLVSRERIAQSRPARLEAAPMREVVAWTEEFRAFWDERFDRLDSYLATMEEDR